MEETIVANEDHLGRTELYRIAFAIPDFRSDKGGAERYLVSLCHYLARQGWAVHVYAEAWAQDESGIHFHRIESFPFPKSLRLLTFATRATRQARRGGFNVTFGVGNTLEADVLQPHGGVHWAWFWRSLEAYDSPLVRTAKFLGRVFSLKQWISGWIEDASYRRGGPLKIIAISEMVKQDMIRWYKIPAERVTVVYNGVDTDRFHPGTDRSREDIRRRHGIGGEFLILFVSNNFRMKGLAYLIRALALLKSMDQAPFRLLVLGRDHPGSYARLAQRMGVSEAVIFGGSTTEPEKYYGAADLLVHPTFYDACSLTVLEALASGLPVVTTASNGACGLLTSNEGGRVVENARDVRALAEAIRHFFTKQRREDASQMARRKAEAHSEKSNFDQIVGILQEAAAMKGVLSGGVKGRSGDGGNALG